MSVFFPPPLSPPLLSFNHFLKPGAEVERSGMGKVKGREAVKVVEKGRKEERME